MGIVFLKVLNLSIVAGWLVLAIVLFRAVFKKIPKWITCTFELQDKFKKNISMPAFLR